jgi:hypothetical protein
MVDDVNQGFLKLTTNRTTGDGRSKQGLFVMHISLYYVESFGE